MSISDCGAALILICTDLQRHICHSTRSVGTGARRGSRQGDERFRVRRLGRAVGAVIGTNLGSALGNVPTEKSAVEELQRRDRLIIGDLVTGLVHASEGKVTILAGLAILDAVDHHWSVTGGTELLSMCVVHREGNGLATEPVADVVGVTVDEGHADGQLEDLLQIFEEIGPDEVAGLLEGVVYIVVRLSVIDVHPDGVHHRVFLEVVDVVRFRGRVLRGESRFSQGYRAPRMIDYKVVSIHRALCSHLPWTGAGCHIRHGYQMHSMVPLVIWSVRSLPSQLR